MSSQDTYPSEWPNIPETLILEDQEGFSDNSKKFVFKSTISELSLRISRRQSSNYTISVRFNNSIHNVHFTSTEKFLDRLAEIYSVCGADQLITPLPEDRYEYIKAIDFDKECIFGLNTSLEVTEEPFDEAEFASFLYFEIPDYITEGGKLCLQFTMGNKDNNSTQLEVYVFENYEVNVEYEFKTQTVTFIPEPETAIDEYVSLKNYEFYTVTTNYVDPEYAPQILSEFV